MSSQRSKKGATPRRTPEAASRSSPDNKGPQQKKIKIAVGAGLLACAAGVFVLAWSRFGSHNPNPTGLPLNILLITLDTTRSDFLGCYGRTPSPSPTLDKLSESGARFAQCSTCVPVTLPSHASIFTGQYPFTHTLRENGGQTLPASVDTLAEIVSRNGYQTSAVIGAMVLNHQFGLSQGFTTYDDFAGSVSMSELAERRADKVVDLALERLRHIASGPFLLWTHFYDPHSPYLSDHPEAPLRDRYADEIAYMDRQIGRLIAELEKLGIEDRTLIVVVGDHGEGLDDHEEIYHGHFVYQPTLHVPLILRLPGKISRGTVVDSYVRTIDLAPTILDLVGAPALDRAQGRSLTPLLAGKNNGWVNQPAYAEAFENYWQFGYSPIRSLIADGFKYVHAPKPELYDLTADPGEVRNLLNDKKEQAAKMRNQMLDLIADAPPPPKDRGAVSLSDSDRRALESLGYVAPADGHNAQTSEMDLFEPKGEDPKDHKDVIRNDATAHAHLIAGRYAEAAAVLESVIKAAPKSGRLRADMAFCLHRMGQPQQAIDWYRQAIELEPEHTHLRKMYVGLLIATQQWQEAQQQLKVILPHAADDAEMWYDMGIVLTSLNQAKEAESHFQRAIDLSPKEARFVHGLGLNYFRQGLLPQAAEQFEKALTLDPKHEPSRRDLARVRERQGP